ncbi:MAG: hypothetical protein E7316_02305 [Clostridiales bacterium]|nr:hypothetical protein [Clostridiales bacterium]
MEYEVKPYGVYVKTDESDRVIAINSSAFLSETEGWTLIDEGCGDRYAHAQGNYLDKTLADDRGIYRYKLVDGKPVERTTEEMDADYVPPEPQPDLTAEVAALRESNAQLKEALELLLSGEVEDSE